MQSCYSVNSNYSLNKLKYGLSEEEMLPEDLPEENTSDEPVNIESEEEQDQPETEPPAPGPKTGDAFNPLLALAALTAAALAMLLAILSYRRDRKDGDVA